MVGMRLDVLVVCMSIDDSGGDFIWLAMFGFCRLANRRAPGPRRSSLFSLSLYLLCEGLML